MAIQTLTRDELDMVSGGAITVGGPGVSASIDPFVMAGAIAGNTFALIGSAVAGVAGLAGSLVSALTGLLGGLPLGASASASVSVSASASVGV